MKKYFLHILPLIAVLFLNACSASEEISQESIQTAIAETQQANDLVSTAVAATMNSFPSEISPTNPPELQPTNIPEIQPTNTPEILPTNTSDPSSGYDYSSWKGYNAPEGYSFNFPTRFNMEIRQGGEGDFIVLVAEGSPPNEVSFSVNSALDQGNLEEIKAGIDLDNAVYSDLSSYGMTGFIVEGTVPGEGFGGGTVVYKAHFALGDILIRLDCPWNFCDRQEFDLILRSFKLN